MTKQEALAKIEELKKFVEGRPKPKVGQIWERDGELFIVIYSSTMGDSTFRLICVTSKDQTEGKYWNAFEVFDGTSPEFTYVGEAHNILKGVKK
jgi:hypothetical protein